MIILVERFCTEIRVCDRELQDNMYTPSAYMAAHFLSSIPQLLVQVSVVCVLGGGRGFPVGVD